MAPLIVCASFLLLCLVLSRSVIERGAGEHEMSRLAGLVQLRPAVEPRRGEPLVPWSSETQPQLDFSRLELALSPPPGAADGLVRDAAGRAARAAAVQGVLGAGGLDHAPRLVSQVKPAYPAELRRQEITARVLVAFEVTTDGRVTDVRVEQSTNPAFDMAAVAAVRQWRFEPGRKGGRPVSFRMRAPITFKP